MKLEEGDEVKMREKEREGKVMNEFGMDHCEPQDLWTKLMEKIYDRKNRRGK